ncbi:ribbon-helix-helix protein, CopG family [Chelatococcus sambhunathii]|uniref:Ribbon-helix-helix protein, CopG family n=1 Tax=Chelatococcus sambhunathii TaxID=363953 RepID=A0ABU1DJL8_9HYPH|nr:ribbon-helix-helix protein, CopG family [Chelatococcus sambhunathii]MDR4308321.1 ribbon-helix-helix protein, CopG family [Chelatococcus sambhunathii]
MSRPQLSDPVAFRLPLEVLDQIETIAETCERTRSWVIVRALRLYLAGEGSEVLAIRRGREQIASGESHDLDDVIGELEAIVAGKAA